MKKTKEYFLGLDLGTGSVGWCVTDTSYHVLKANRKRTIGTVLFSTAETAQKRRINRCARRRLKRRQERLRCLQELFFEEIQKVDEGFFHRLKESSYIPEDKENPDGSRPQFPYALFVDPGYTDVQYFRQYPTIYHLRKELMDDSSRHDVRLIYLAVAHILKHRGHFLADIQAGGSHQNIETLLSDFIKTWNEYMENPIILSDDEKNSLEKLLVDSGMLKSEKKRQVFALLHTKGKQFKEMAALLTGASVSLEKLFEKVEYKELEESKLQFDESSYEEKEDYYQDVLGDDFEIIVKARAVYNYCALSRILKNNPSGRISDAKVEDYEKHKAELKLLKRVLNEYFSDEAREKVLNNTEAGFANYAAYIGTARKNGRKEVVQKRCSKDEFYKFLDKEVLSQMEDCDEKTYIKTQIQLGEFLPRQKGTDNSVIPYQLHKRELELILKNAESYLPFLKQQDESGFSVSEKILQLMTFRIPYYVGPLGGIDQENSHGWMLRQESGKIYPWNFEQKVDVEETAKKFIQRATNHCTYLKNEDVLPACSLLFEKYKVLNELNTVRIRGERLSVFLKQKIYNDLFCRHARITKKRMIQYLKKEGYYDQIDESDISGIDGNDFKASLKSWLIFKQIHFDQPISILEMEDIILDSTLFGEAPKLYKKRLLAKYPQYEKQIPVIVKNVRCKGWAPFSRKLLEGLTAGIESTDTIISLLWNEQKNFMEILYDPAYGFLKLIEKENGGNALKDGGISYQLVEELYVSPSVKRQIWMALQTVREVMHFMGDAPKRIFVEMAREKGKPERTTDRKSYLEQLYKAVGEEKDLLEELRGCTNDQLRKDKLFLYFTQLGCSAYSGNRISFSGLGNNNEYDIDHIYPRSKTADDSINNRVLVTRQENEDKKDHYPITAGVQRKCSSLWKMWHEKGLIGDEKYYRLIRNTPLTEEELCGYVSRQLIETRQGTKALTELLEKLTPEQTEIVYVKAKHISEFRHTFNLLKVRDLNEFHHSRDAYLSIVVGNVYHLKFTKDVRKYFAQNGTYRTYNLEKMYENPVVYENETAWEVNKTIAVIKAEMADNRILVSRQIYEEKGQLYDVQRMKKGKGQVPVKAEGRMADISKYGGYNKATITYFVLIKAEDKKGKEGTYILPVPLCLSRKIEESAEYAQSYFKQEYGFKSVKIREKIRMQTLFIYEGFRMRLAGKSGSRILFHNANQLCLPEKYYRTIREIRKHVTELQTNRNAKISDRNPLTEEKLDDLYQELCEKLKTTVYKTMLGGYIEKYESGYECYQKLSLEKKAEALFQMLKIFQCTPEMPDLTLIGGSRTQMALNIGFNVTDKKSLAIIHQSVTGIYEKLEKIGE